MNIHYTITAYPPSIGGAQLHLANIARILSQDNDVRVSCFWDCNRTDWLLGTTLKSPQEPKLYYDGTIPVSCIGLSNKEKASIFPYVLMYYPVMGLAIKKISAMIEEHLSSQVINPDIIHNMRIGREPLSFASYNLAKKLDIPFAFSPIHHPRWSGWLHRYFQDLYRKADLLLALTHKEKEILVQFKVDPRKVFVIGNGPVIAKSSDPERFRSQYSLGNYPFVLFLGQKYEYKGIRALLESTHLVWQNFPDTHFVFIGPRTNYSIHLFTEIVDRRIIEIDTVDLQTKTDALAACTLLCVPSSQESFGGVYTEAWCFSNPVIGCKIPAVSEVIDDGKNGLLTEQDPEMIADKIVQLLRDDSLSAKFGKAGNQKVNEKYSWEKIAGLTLDAYKVAISGNY